MAGTIAAFTFVILCVTLMLSLYDARMASRTARMAASLQEAIRRAIDDGRRIGIAGDDDGRPVGPQVAREANDVEAGNQRHGEVGDDEVELLAARARSGPAPRRRRRRW